MEGGGKKGGEGGGLHGATASPGKWVVSGKGRVSIWMPGALHVLWRDGLMGEWNGWGWRGWG